MKFLALPLWLFFPTFSQLLKKNTPKRQKARITPGPLLPTYQSGAINSPSGP
jgi:hypothetical protein